MAAARVDPGSTLPLCSRIHQGALSTDFVLQAGIAFGVCAGLALEHDRFAVRHDKPVANQQRPRLPEGDLRVILSDLARSLWGQQKRDHALMLSGCARASRHHVVRWKIVSKDAAVSRSIIIGCPNGEPLRRLVSARWSTDLSIKDL